MTTEDFSMRTDNNLIKTIASYASGLALIAAVTMSSVL